MSGTTPTARFRIRLEDGSEVLVSSVEALARRVQRGDVGPNTPLFDGSTGAWSRAGDAPVVRFILEDIAAEGGELPPGWEDPAVSAPPGIAAGVMGREGPDAALLGTVDPNRGGDDPLDFGITVVQPPADPADLFPSVPHPPERVADPKPTPLETREWLTHPGADELHPARPQPPPPSERGVRRAEPAGPLGEPVRAPAAPRPSAGRPREEPSVRRGPRPALFVAVAGAVLFAGVLLFWDGSGDGDPSEDAFAERGGINGQSLVSVQAAAASQAPPPAELAPNSARALDVFALRIQNAVDSLRAAHGIGGAPPPQWLGGPYLADADDYAEVRSFWEGYIRLVGDLRAIDRAIFLSVVDEAAARMGDRPADAGRLRDYLAGRYLGMEPSRRGRAAQLIEVAEHAVALHDFLVTASAELRYTPALGATVPRDPVLEVGTDNPAVLQALNDHLDRLFDALDRSRGGGALSQGGLREDLFLGFGVL